MAASRDDFCAKCARVTALAGEYKQLCRNSDQLICIETCAKYCHFACFCAATDRLDHGMMKSLESICTWCNDVCENLGLNRQRECCRDFHAHCRELSHMCVSLSEAQRYRGVSAAEAYSDNNILEVGRACQRVYQAGIVAKPTMLMTRKDVSHEGFGTIEACLKLCNAMSFMAQNACEHINAAMLDCCMQLCHGCLKLKCCDGECRACIAACVECSQCTKHQESNLDDVVQTLLAKALTGEGS